LPRLTSGEVSVGHAIAIRPEETQRFSGAAAGDGRQCAATYGRRIDIDSVRVAQQVARGEPEVRVVEDSLRIAEAHTQARTGDFIAFDDQPDVAGRQNLILG